MSLKAQSVSDIVHGVKSLLEGEYRSIHVEGEVSNLSKTMAGHIYFSLVDSDSQLSCAIFKADVLRNPIMRTLKIGDKILVSGSISVYTKRGVFQLIAKRITPLGGGDLKAQFERLKSDFLKKGYFDHKHKKALPRFPKRIAIITAPHGAALQDFLNVMKRRSLSFDILIAPAIVQGEKSEASLIKALKRVIKVKDIDVIVLTRGGGAIEDLWSFNSEKLVEEIFKCEIPIISAIGHQVDFTLCDFVSDVRAETPTSAAEILSRPQVLVSKELSNLFRGLKLFLLNEEAKIQKKLERINPKNMLLTIKHKLERQKVYLDSFNISSRAHELTGISESSLLLDELIERLLKAVAELAQKYERRLSDTQLILTGLDPKKVLMRGYTFVSYSGKIISSRKEYLTIESDKDMLIHFKDGNEKIKKA